MRTSPSQFQLLVEYMERNGDLSKPTEGPSGRATNLRHWEELARVLNADATGDTKTVEKWRKVWSDLKNNTKKKSARIFRAAQQTGGGPASSLKLTDVEERVLSLIGTQAATGFVHIPELGFEENIPTEVAQVEISDTHNSPSVLHFQERFFENNSNVEDLNQPGTSAQSFIFPPLPRSNRGRGELVGREVPETEELVVSARQEPAQHIADTTEARLTDGGPASRPQRETSRHEPQGPTPFAGDVAWRPRHVAGEDV